MGRDLCRLLCRIRVKAFLRRTQVSRPVKDGKDADRARSSGTSCSGAERSRDESCGAVFRE